MFMEWDDSYSVHVREIDLQHQKLMGMINEFYDHVGKDPGQAFRALLDSLVEYTKYHFSTEEKYFRRFSYADSGNHVQMHQRFTEKVVDAKRRLDEGKFVISLEVTTFLKEWLVQHIKVSDMAYSRCFNENGLT